MSKTKTWAISGFVYLGIVIAGYSIITGANPLESGGHLEQGEHQMEETDEAPIHAEHE